MSHNSEDLMFGSDAFLDVLSNMVGILIILIVVVLGMRVAPPPGTVPIVQKAPEVPVELELEPEVPELLPEQLPPMEEIKPSPEMLARAAKLRELNTELNVRFEQLQAEESKLAQQKQDQAGQILQLQQEVADKVDELRSDQGQVSTLEMNVTSLRAEVAALQQRLVDMETSDDAPVEQLTHRLPPIGKVVSGDEIHFRLEGNRVSQVPIDDLVKEVQRDIERRKEILISRSFYQGSTRPINGYLMEYVLQRLATSVVDELRSGPGMVRIGVTSWVIRPVGPIHAETADEALREGSRFRAALMNASPTTTVTFWVYPDSFDVHKRLTSLTYDANLWVASRPLPVGVPIAGSPQGSRSVAQ
jgi:hypothetical protein